MTLKGKRILLVKPLMKESPIKLSDEAQKSLDEENVKFYTRLKIFEVGDMVFDYKKNDEVYVATDALKNSEIIDMNGTITMLINEGSIVIKW